MTAMRNWSLMTSGLEPEFRRSLSKLEPRRARNVHETAGDIPAQARCSLAVCSEACLEAIFDVCVPIPGSAVSDMSTAW